MPAPIGTQYGKAQLRLGSDGFCVAATLNVNEALIGMSTKDFIGIFGGSVKLEIAIDGIN